MNHSIGYWERVWTSVKKVKSWLLTVPETGISEKIITFLGNSLLEGKQVWEKDKFLWKKENVN